MTVMQTALRLIYPDQCVGCGDLVEGAHGLCGRCWVDTPFIRGTLCNTCGQQLLGGSAGGSEQCDECLAADRPWSAGRAAMLYEGSGRRIVLGLKHGDRTDLARPAAKWMAQAGADILTRDCLLVPVPAHWTRTLRRRYNQAAELAKAVGVITGCEVMPDALKRGRMTRVQDGMTVEERFQNLAQSMQGVRDLNGRKVVLIDDVMTSGATLTAASQACFASGAARVSVLVLARVVKSA